MTTAKKSTPKVRTPDAESSERALVGAVLSDPERVLPIVSKRGLEVDHFTDAEARQVWGAITRLSEAGNPIDPVTVAAKTCPLWTLRTGHRPTHADIAEARAALQTPHGGADLGATNAS